MEGGGRVILVVGEALSGKTTTVGIVRKYINIKA